MNLTDLKTKSTQELIDIAKESMGKAGGRLEDVVRTRVYVTDRALADEEALRARCVVQQGEADAQHHWLCDEVRWDAGSRRLFPDLHRHRSSAAKCGALSWRMRSI